MKLLKWSVGCARKPWDWRLWELAFIFITARESRENGSTHKTSSGFFHYFRRTGAQVDLILYRSFGSVVFLLVEMTFARALDAIRVDALSLGP